LRRRNEYENNRLNAPIKGAVERNEEENVSRRKNERKNTQEIEQFLVAQK